MKMKEVTGRTGLSSRTVRFYMEEKLISPCYTENYLGRRTFDFSEEDVQALRDIATLRRFGFSIEEIRRVKEDPESCIGILPEIRQRKQKTIEAEQAALTALNRLDETKFYDLSELARELEAPASESSLPAEDQQERLPLNRRIRWLAVFALGTMPVLLPWFWFNFQVSSWSGIALLREPFRIGCLLMLALFFVSTERQAAVVRLISSLLVSTDYVLAFVYFQERGNIAGGIDFAASLRAVQWTYWVAAVVLTVYVVRTALDCAESLLRRQ